MANSILFPGLENTDSYAINAFDMHVVFVVLLLLASLVGLWAVLAHYRKLFVRWENLALSVACVGFIGAGELLEHLAAPPGVHYWHYIHLGASVAALYFLYSFSRTWDSKAPSEGMEIALPLLTTIALVSGISYLSFKTEIAYGMDFDAYIFVGLALLTLYFFVKAMAGMQRMYSSLRGSFSLKLFLLTSSATVFAAALFLLTITVNLLGVFSHVLPNIELMALARILQNTLYVVLASSMVSAAFMTRRAEEAYAPIARFISRGKKAK